MISRSAKFVLVAAALAAPPKGGETAQALFERYRAHLLKAGTVEARCGFDFEPLLMSSAAKFEGTGRFTVRMPSFMRVETDPLKAVGKAGGGPATVVIQRNARWWKSVVVSQDYLQHYELQKSAGAAPSWAEGIPKTDLVRPPFPPGILVQGARAESVRADTLGGASAQVLTVSVPGHGQVPASRFRWWLDPDHLALLRHEMLGDAGQVVSRHDYADFKDAGTGYRFPSSCVHYGADGKPDLNCFYFDYQFGKTVSDSLFVPEGIPFDPKAD